MRIIKCYWLDDNTFCCHFGNRIDNDGEWFELVGEYQKDHDRFIFERQYEDQVLPVQSVVTQLMMKHTMIAWMENLSA